MLAYILFDPKLHAALCEETSVAYQDDEVDVPYLMDKCPRLDAAYLEVLRIVNTALSARKTIASTPIGDQVLSSGNTIFDPLPSTASKPESIRRRPRPLRPGALPQRSRSKEELEL